MCCLLALEMDTAKRQARMRLLRSYVREHNVSRSAGNLITELAELRIEETRRELGYPP